MSGAADWHAWHRDYDDPASPLSRRLTEVRSRLRSVLSDRDGPMRLLNLCSGDARDTIPVVAACGREVDVCLVELDSDLAERARRSAAEAGLAVDVLTGDAGDTTTYAERLPVDVLLLIGVLGNVADADAERTVAAAASMVTRGGTVIWTRSNKSRTERTHTFDDPADWVRGLFVRHGFDEVDFLRPPDMSWRLGVARLREPSAEPVPERLFTFVR